MWTRRLKYWWQRDQRSATLRDEMDAHVAEKAADLQSDGLTPEQAMAEAWCRFGNAGLNYETSREIWMIRFWSELGQDCRYALRTMAANRMFSALAILSLALGIGANTAIYSFMDSLLIRSLPVSDPKSLAVLNWHAKARTRESVRRSQSGTSWREGEGTTSGIFPFPAFELLQKNSGAIFSSVFAYYPTRNVNVMVKGQAEQASGEFVSGEYFRGLAITPAAGRMILPDDDRAGGPAIAVLSFPFSQRRFGAGASALGQAIVINGIPFSVVGIAPSGFFGVDPATAPDFYLPLHSSLLLRQKFGANEASVYLDQNFYWLEMMARLRPGVSLSQAQASLRPMFHQWVESTAANDRERANLPELRIGEGAAGLDTLRRQYSKPLYVLLAMVGLILAIACSNIASLLLARATARRREMGGSAWARDASEWSGNC